MRFLVVVAAVVASVGALSAGSGKRRCGPDVVCVTRVVTAELRSTAPPPSRGPLPPAGLVFSDAEHGFLGSKGGAIQTTADGGSTWQTVWRGAGTSISWIGLAGDGTVVAAADHGRRHELVTSADGGRTWTVVTASVPASRAVFFRWSNLRFQFVDARVGFGWPNPYGAGDSSPVIRTTDGGAHWTALVTSFGVSSVHFVTEQLGYATGSPPNGKPCYSELFRTADGGNTWAPVAGTCRNYSLWGIDTPDADRVYVGGGAGYWEANSAFQAVLESDDAGQTWRTLSARPTGSADLPIVDLHFVDAADGWAETGSCKGGQNSPCGGEVLTTSDGGRSWQETGHDGALLATAGSGQAWTCCDWDSVVWRTRDRGRTWQPLARPETVAPRSVGAAWPWLTATTAIGQLVSRDGGKTWRHYGSPTALLDQPAALIRPGLEALVDGGSVVRVSRDGGRTWTARRPLGRNGEVDSIAFADARHGIAGCSSCGDEGTPTLAVTDDAGRRWHVVSYAPAPATLADAPGMAGMAIEPNGIAFSRDGGRNWTAEALPRDDLCSSVATAAPAKIWVGCEHSVGDTSVDYLLASSDGGVTWTRIDVHRASFDSLAASPDGRGPLLAVGVRWTRTAVPTVWESRDGGRTWTQTWIPAG